MRHCISVFEEKNEALTSLQTGLMLTLQKNVYCHSVKKKESMASTTQLAVLKGDVLEVSPK